MALWSLFVEVGTERYSTQVRAVSARAAMATFLKGSSLSQVLGGSKFKGWPKSFSMKDVILFIAMDGLVNMYLCQLGQEGNYVSVTLARTVSRQQT
jgi:hypothetical protein